MRVVAGGVARRAERDDERRRRGAHRLDVGGILGDRLAADVERRRPVEPEVPALDQHVGRHHGPAVGGGDHGGVVAGAQQDGAAAPARSTSRSITANSPSSASVSARLVVGHHTSCRRLRALNTGATCGTFGPCGVESMPARTEDETRVVEAFVLVQTEVGRAEVVAKHLAALPGVVSSEYVTGPYDVVVRVSADTLGRAAVRRRPERAAGHRHHPHPDLSDRRRGAP